MLFPDFCELVKNPEPPEKLVLDYEENNEDVPKEIILVENIFLDLESYIRQYEGYAKLTRLLFIAEHCPPLRIEALSFALEYIKTTHNTGFYQKIYKQLKDAISSLDDVDIRLPPLDNHWIEVTDKKSLQTIERLDNDLKNYKSNSIKESIRRGNYDLADHYMDRGDLSNASKSYARTRDYCATVSHFVDMCLNVMKIAVFTENWAQVTNYFQKADRAAIQFKTQVESVLQMKLKCVFGLAQLAKGKYKNAAKYFLQVSYDNFDYPDLLTVNNVATYGTLCALATYDRTELRKNMFSIPGFKQFVDSEPQLRIILETFCQCNYDSCLTLMAEIKNHLLLDIFLAPHVNNLYTLIRKKALCQYFSPYLSADMHKMAEAFNTNVKDLEDELMQLVLEGQINARIDSHNKILYAKDIDQRSTTFEKSIAVGQEYERRTKAMVIWSVLMKHEIFIMSPISKGNPLAEVFHPSSSTKLRPKLN